jgi:hypothetical protein
MLKKLFDTDAFAAMGFDHQFAHPFSSPSLMTNRLHDSVYGELTNSMVRTKKQSDAVLTGSQNAHSLALQSLVNDFKQNIKIEQDDWEMLVGKHFRKQDKLLEKAVDELLRDVF